MAKEGSKLAGKGWNVRRSPVNTDGPWPDLDEAWSRVLSIQAKLHRWATDESDRRFDDLFNLVCDPAFLVVAWDRVRSNKGGRTAGVDGVKPRSVDFGQDRFLSELRDDLKARRFVPLPVRERLIPKSGGKAARPRYPHRPGQNRPGGPQAGA
jgi:RNA-directed DNA polymerase